MSDPSEPELESKGPAILQEVESSLGIGSLSSDGADEVRFTSYGNSEGTAGSIPWRLSIPRTTTLTPSSPPSPRASAIPLANASLSYSTTGGTSRISSTTFESARTTEWERGKADGASASNSAKGSITGNSSPTSSKESSTLGASPDSILLADSEEFSTLCDSSFISIFWGSGSSLDITLSLACKLSTGANASGTADASPTSSKESSTLGASSAISLNLPAISSASVSPYVILRLLDEEALRRLTSTTTSSKNTVKLQRLGLGSCCFKFNNNKKIIKKSIIELKFCPSKEIGVEKRSAYIGKETIKDDKIW